MKIEMLKETKEAAAAKWHEYAQAFKKTRDPIYGDLKKVYNQIKNGNVVIDIFTAIQGGGVREGNQPNLAIAKAVGKKVFCRYYGDGSVNFCNGDEWKRPMKADVVLKKCLPAWNKKWDGASVRLQAPVPIIPPRLRPAILTDDYYILWEVDTWTPLPSRDPYLLKRITSNLFVVCAAWDLTDIEMAVMAGRVR